MSNVSGEDGAADIYTFDMQDTGELYGAAATRELDRRLIEEYGIAGYSLMCKAAAGCWRELCRYWPQAQRIVVLCGGGNNGGDGYEVARLALAAGCEVNLFEFNGGKTRGDAATARQAWVDDGGTCQAWTDSTSLADDTEVIVDAIFGTGLSRPPAGMAAAAIEAVNTAHAQDTGVLAVDVPSGLDVDRGAALGVCVEADITVTFIGRKFGLYTGAGPDYAGRVIFDPLADAVFGIDPPPRKARVLDVAELRHRLPRRPRDPGARGRRAADGARVRGGDPRRGGAHRPGRHGGRR
ncbi:MAG: NAD(P)H-hydrate epimerase, partial [Sinobacteraceae bacterium]|nr:NAD(P)H-hydrate epimerase [Nevskiaceae bacterium]